MVAEQAAKVPVRRIHAVRRSLRELGSRERSHVRQQGQAPSVRFPEPAISEPMTPPRPAPTEPPRKGPESKLPNWADAVAGTK